MSVDYKKFFREIPEFLKVLGFENGYYDENNHEWVTEFLPSEDLTHSNGSIVQGGFVTGMLDASMAQCIMFKSNGEDLPLTLDIDVKFLNSCIPDHKVTSRAKIIKQGKSIVFTTANLFQRDDLIATASASNKIIKFKF
jgi:acyl-coenzyme A thioesterase PaaI-like protein